MRKWKDPLLFRKHSRPSLWFLGAIRGIGFPPDILDPQAALGMLGFRRDLKVCEKFALFLPFIISVVPILAFASKWLFISQPFLPH